MFIHSAVALLLILAQQQVPVPPPTLKSGSAEIQLLRIGIADVSDDLAVLTEEQPAVRVQHDPLGHGDVGRSQAIDS